MTPEALKATLAAHALWLAGKGGTSANLSGSDLRRADLSAADLRFADLSGAKWGYESDIAKRLCLLGACTAAKNWVESRKGCAGGFGELLVASKDMDPEWVQWLAENLGSAPTEDNFMTVTNYILRGAVGF